jgi:hypothetical protein
MAPASAPTVLMSERPDVCSDATPCAAHRAVEIILDEIERLTAAAKADGSDLAANVALIQRDALLRVADRIDAEATGGDG